MGLCSILLRPIRRGFQTVSSAELAYAVNSAAVKYRSSGIGVEAKVSPRNHRDEYGIQTDFWGKTKDSTPFTYAIRHFFTWGPDFNDVYGVLQTQDSEGWAENFQINENRRGELDRLELDIERDSLATTLWPGLGAELRINGYLPTGYRKETRKASKEVHAKLREVRRLIKTAMPDVLKLAKTSPAYTHHTTIKKFYQNVA